MRLNPKDFVRGLGVSALSLALYAIALACFNALMLLIISMEEGGQGVTDYTMNFTESVILLSQGVGLEFETIHLTLIPWGLTILLIVLIRSAASRLGSSWPGLLTGLALWVAMHAWMAATVQMVLIDSMPVILLKTGAIYAIGYLWALIPRTNLVKRIRLDNISVLPSPVLMALREALRLTGILFTCFMLMAGITVITWVALNHQAMHRLFHDMGMATGSAVMTTIASLIWLPTFMVWALSWVSGGGFSIGSIATFSLWNGQAQSLPTIPVFALFPEAIALPWARITLMAIPFALSLILGIWQVFSAKRFNVLERNSGQDPRETSNGDSRNDDSHGFVSWQTMRLFVPPAIAFCLACVLLSVLLPVIFTMANGSLGYDRLAHVGVDIATSTQALARPTALGFLSAWVFGLIISAARYAFTRLSTTARNRHENTPDDKRSARTVNSGDSESLSTAMDHDNGSVPSASTGDSSEHMNDRNTASGNHDGRTSRTVSSDGHATAQSSATSTVGVRTFRTVSSAESVNPTIKEDR
ncbi:hypothetical protein EP30_05565 [Bifidobacterium sp. UTCIF-39]|uniref:cell division protein PerM n=1 Tax=Bifidobacterium sp. UTCIF-39 TaxID=1465359 RepID=UPI00112D00BB|nr:DUF6350 family protein [Bifidobacterium sp. UTCIF-39]TPF96877.1 hypothetical protein EP30_05565 [Bifidobacterium sp. UTCIF-39]